MGVGTFGHRSFGNRGEFRLAGLLALVVAAFFIAPSPSRADIPQPISCSDLRKFASGTYVGWSGQSEWPEPRLAIGRVAWASMYSYAYQLKQAEVRNRSISFSSVRKSKPISLPFSRNLTEDAAKKGVAIRFKKGDGPGRITIKWEQLYPKFEAYEGGEFLTYTDISCTRTRSRVIKPVPGIVPDIDWNFRYIGINGTEQLLGSYWPKRYYCQPSYQTVAPGDLILRVAGGGARTKFNMGQICGRDRFTTQKNKAWVLKVSGRRFSLSPKWRKPGTRIVRISARLGSRRALKSRIRFKTIHAPYKRIWEGTDAFINTCINGLHDIYSSGGRLYCSVGGRTYTEFKILSWKSTGR